MEAMRTKMKEKSKEGRIVHTWADNWQPLFFSVIICWCWAQVADLSMGQAKGSCWDTKKATTSFNGVMSG